MSLTRKKVNLNEYLQLSLTQKLRENPSRNQFRRKCCQKQNDHCKEGRQCRSRQESKSMKKLMKKKYLEEEVEKLLQKRANESDQKINLLKEKNTNQIEGLRQDLKSMKNVILKLTYDDGKGRKEDEEDQREQQFRAQCNAYEKRIDELKKDLERAYLKVRQNEKKSGEQASKIANLKKEAKQYCKKIETLRVVAQTSVKNEERLQSKLFQVIQNEKNLKQQVSILESELQILRQTLSQNNSSIQAKQNKNCELMTRIQQIRKNNELALNSFKTQKQRQFFVLRQQLKQAQQALKTESQAKIQMQNSLNKMKQELRSTSIDLGNTKVKLTVLSSMQKKCQELFDQIKSEKQKWSQYNLETSNERQNYEKRICMLQQLKLETEEQKIMLESKEAQLLSQISKLQSENKRLFQDKINLSKQLKKLEENLSIVAEEKKNNSTKAQSLKRQYSNLEETLREKERQWKTIKLSQQKKIQTLQNQKYTIQKEINKNLQNTKGQIAHLQSQTTLLNSQIEKLTEEKQMLNRNFQELLQKVVSNQQYSEKLQKDSREKDQNIEKYREELESYKTNIKVYEKKMEQIKAKVQQEATLLKSKFQSQIKTKQGQINELEKYNNFLKTNFEQSISIKDSQIQQLKQKIAEISTQLLQMNTQLKHITKQLINQQQQNAKLSNDLAEGIKKLEQSKVNLTKIENNGRHTIIELQNKYHNVNVKLQFIEKQANSWKKKSQQLQQSFLIEKTRREQYEFKWSQSQSIRLSLSSELSELLSNTKRSQEQIQLYQREINLKNKSISQLKQIIRVVKNQSLLVKQQVDSYKIEFQEMQLLREQQTNRSSELNIQYEQLQRLTLEQVKYMRQRLEDLDFDKKDLSIQINQLKQRNIQLQDVFKGVNIQFNWREEKFFYQNEISLLKHSIQQNNQQYERIKRNMQQNLDILSKQLEMKGKQLQMVSKMLEDQRQQCSDKIRKALTDFESTKSILQEENAISQKLAKIIQQKEEVIKQLTQKSMTYQSKKNTIRTQVQSIQNQISLLSDRNISLQQQNEILEGKVKEFQQKQKLFEQKLCTIMQSKYLVQQRNGELEQQINMMQKQLYKSQQKQKSLVQQSERKIKEVYQICERRKEEIVKQLTINLNNKYEQTTIYVRKNAQAQQVLRENHQYLENEKSLRKKLQIQVVELRNEVDKLQAQNSSIKRDSQCLARDKSIVKQRLAEIQNRYQLLIKKIQVLEQQKTSIIRQIQNNQMTIRILREQNGSIEKVMSQQINQHKSIIQQLVNEKKLLYSQFQRQ